MDRILEDIIDSKVPREKDLIPEAFPDYEDLNALNEVRRPKRSVANEDTVIPVEKAAEVVLRHSEENKEGVALAKGAIKTAGVIN